MKPIGLDSLRIPAILERYVMSRICNYITSIGQSAEVRAARCYFHASTFDIKSRSRVGSFRRGPPAELTVAIGRPARQAADSLAGGGHHYQCQHALPISSMLNEAYRIGLPLSRARFSWSWSLPGSHGRGQAETKRYADLQKMKVLHTLCIYFPVWMRYPAISLGKSSLYVGVSRAYLP